MTMDRDFWESFAKGAGDVNRPGQPGRTEASSDHRSSAATLWQMYVALQDAGFTKKEAFQLTRDWFVTLVASLKKGQ